MRQAGGMAVDADTWTQAVRHQLGLGRLLPLGGSRDGAWIAERAATAVLVRAADGVPGVRLGALRLA
ncbi:nucleopolyhedrovirus P10 family protein, partial [Streptomyces sp. AF1A]